MFNEEAGGQVYLINSDSKNIKGLGSFSPFRNAWSPSSQQIAFATGDGVAVMNIDGSNIHIIHKMRLIC